MDCQQFSTPINNGKYLPGFPLEPGSNGRGEPAVIFRDAGSDNACIFTAHQSDTVWLNELYGLRYNNVIEGLPVKLVSDNPTASTALLPLGCDSIGLVYSTNNGMTAVYKLPFCRKGSSLEWAMEGGTSGGNRVYCVEEHRVRPFEETEYRISYLPANFSYSKGIKSFCIEPLATGELIGSCQQAVWAGVGSKIKLPVEVNSGASDCGIFFIRVQGKEIREHKGLLLR